MDNPIEVSSDEIKRAGDRFATLPRNININEQGIYQAGIRVGFKEGAEFIKAATKELQLKIKQQQSTIKELTIALSAIKMELLKNQVSY